MIVYTVGGTSTLSRREALQWCIKDLRDKGELVVAELQNIPDRGCPHCGELLFPYQELHRGNMTNTEVYIYDGELICDDCAELFAILESEQSDLTETEIMANEKLCHLL